MIKKQKEPAILGYSRYDLGLEAKQQRVGKHSDYENRNSSVSSSINTPGYRSNRRKSVDDHRSDVSSLPYVAREIQVIDKYR